VIRPALFVAACAFLVSPAAWAKGKTPPATPAASEEPDIDISALKDRMVVLTDGKQHYFVLDAWGDEHNHTYYGDSRRLYSQRWHLAGHQQKESWERTFWEPRVNALWRASVAQQKDATPSVRCGDRTTELTVVAGDERDRLLAGAKFYAPLWKYSPYALARDQKGFYYYVDRPRDPPNNKAFRLFAGTRGDFKPLKMTNVVSDSEGDIFTTPKGQLRLVLDQKHSMWVVGKKETELVSLPIEENRIMIYTDLGIYAGQRLGTPCDDMM
jgi:hypothetical protein